MSKPIYLNNTYLSEHTATIISHDNDDKGAYLILDESIFYPQSGGQPSDQGIIHVNHKEIAIHFVRQVANEIRHYFNNDDISKIELSPVKITIDLQRRLLNARYHTAAHLLGNIVEEKYPPLKAIKGHSFPNESYVEFHGQGEINTSEIESLINNAISQKLTTSAFEITPEEFET